MTIYGVIRRRSLGQSHLYSDARREAFSFIVDGTSLHAGVARLASGLNLRKTEAMFDIIVECQSN